MEIKVKKLYPDAIMPTHGTPESAGWDVYAYLPDGPVTLWAGRAPQKISVGIATEFPKGYYGAIRGRSGLASQGLMIFDGTVDSDYRGEWFIVCRAIDSMHTINNGDRIGQFVVTQLPVSELVEVTELTPSERGEGGYGSTGT